MYCIYTTDGGNRTDNNFDCHNIQQVFTAVPWNTCSRESQKFQTSFQLSTRSPHHSKDVSGKLTDLEIQKFQVWSLPWVVCFLRVLFSADHESSSAFNWQSISAHFSYICMYLLIYMRIFINMSLACLILDRQRIVCWCLCIQMHRCINVCV